MSATALFSKEFVADLISETVVAWSIAATEVFFYGVYLVMFGFYLHVLRTHGMTKHRFLTVSTISLFILGTAHCALELAITILHVRAQTDDNPSIIFVINAEVKVSQAASAIYVTSNVIADSIFIFRCYAIWGFRRNIIILPTILTLGVAGLGYSNFIMDVGNGHLDGDSLFLIFSVSTSLITTFVLMGLTGRIWWLARSARHMMGRKVVNKYYTVCAMILESGALYCIGGICFIILAIHILLPDSILSGAVLGQLVGIAPTIITVRVGLGYSVENVGSFIAAAPRTRPLPQGIPATPSMESFDDQVLHIRAECVKAEAV